MKIRWAVFECKDLEARLPAGCIPYPGRPWFFMVLQHYDSASGSWNNIPVAEVESLAIPKVQAST